MIVEQVKTFQAFAHRRLSESRTTPAYYSVCIFCVCVCVCVRVCVPPSSREAPCSHSVAGSSERKRKSANVRCVFNNTVRSSPQTAMELLTTPIAWQVAFATPRVPGRRNAFSQIAILPPSNCILETAARSVQKIEYVCCKSCLFHLV